jgi:hypothetical protein
MEWKPLAVNELIDCMNKGTKCFKWKEGNECISFRIGGVSVLPFGECFVEESHLYGQTPKIFSSRLVGISKGQAYALWRMSNGFKVKKKASHIDSKSLGPRTDLEIQECIDKSTLLYTLMNCHDGLFIKKGYIIKSPRNASLYIFYANGKKTASLCSKEYLFYTKQAVLKKLEKVLKEVSQ